MGLRLNDLTDASGSNTVLGSKLYFIPSATAQVVQFEGTLTRTDENIFPFLRVVHGVLQDETCIRTQKSNFTYGVALLHNISF